MTTAHRPTWHTAKGGTEQGGNVLINPSRAYSSKDMPAHTSLKERTREQGDLSEQNKINFRRDLLEREEALIVGKKRLRNDDDSQQPAAALQLMDKDEEEVMVYGDDESEEAAVGGSAGGV